MNVRIVHIILIVKKIIGMSHLCVFLGVFWNTFVSFCVCFRVIRYCSGLPDCEFCPPGTKICHIFGYFCYFSGKKPLPGERIDPNRRCENCKHSLKCLMENIIPKRELSFSFLFPCVLVLRFIVIFMFGFYTQ